MAKKKAGTLEKVAKTVKKAAKAVAETAEEYVVEPVGKALGLTKSRKRTTHSKSRTPVKAGVARTKSARSKSAGKSSAGKSKNKSTAK
jgi:hypothetical protein